MKKYCFLENTADIKIRAYGKKLEEAFSNCAYGLKEIIKKEKIEDRIEKKINIKSENQQRLLHKFLEEFIYLLEGENFIFSKIKKIKVEKNTLNAVIMGDSALNYDIRNPVKAVTYSEISIKRGKEGFICEVVFDV